MERKTITKANLKKVSKHSLGYFLNKKCVIQLMGYQHDKFVTGTIEYLTPYEVFVRIDDDLVAIFKHAIISIALA